MKWDAYLRLMRFDKPAGILLLWYPTAWALWNANKGAPSLKLFLLFFSGTIIMRSVGCIINDIADRHIDKHVTRTKLRPLTAGEVTLFESLLLVMVLLFCALLVVLCLPRECFYVSLIALFITAVYPYCKRFIDAPQLVLGFAFSMGIPMAYIASGVRLESQFILLFVINFIWIIAYDTMYAMTDKEDDLRIGVKSTAIFFASYDLLIVGLLQILLHGLWLYWALLNTVDFWFYLIWGLAGGLLIYQQQLISGRVREKCFKAFLMNAYYGGLMWLAVVAA